MDEDQFFRILFIVLYVVFIGIRIYYKVQESDIKHSGVVQQKGIDKIGGKAGVVLSLAIIGYWLSVALYLPSPSWILRSQLPLPSLVRWIGVGAGIISLPVLIWIHHTLGKHYSASLELKEGHTLVTTGLYSRVHHPMYSVLNTFSVFIALVSANLLVLPFSIIVLLPFPSIVSKEEQMMLNQSVMSTVTT